MTLRRYSRGVRGRCWFGGCLVAVAVLAACGDDDDSTDATLGPLDATAGVTTPGATIGTGDPSAGPATTVDPATAGAGFVSIQVRLPASGIDETLALDRATVSADALDPVSLDAFCTPLDGGAEMAVTGRRPAPPRRRQPADLRGVERGRRDGRR